MKTITEDYVSFETAKLLQEKGFPQKTSVCNTVYKPNGNISNNAKSFISPNYFYRDIYTFAPTLQMARKWLRVFYNLFISMDIGVQAYIWTIYNTASEITVYYIGVTIGTPEQAYDEAIKYCVENLI